MAGGSNAAPPPPETDFFVVEAVRRDLMLSEMFDKVRTPPRCSWSSGVASAHGVDSVHISVYCSAHSIA